MNVIGRYWHTLRPLRAVQFYGRLWFRLKRPRPDLRAAPQLRDRQSEWQAPVTRPVSMLAEAEFLFLGQRGKVQKPGDWNDPAKDKLWLYNLHYFDDLNAANAAERNAWHDDLIHLWIVDNPPGQGNGWEPYPLSLRIVNWIKRGLAGSELTADAQHSLAIQIRFLRARLEWHLLGNHLFANAVALVFAGLYFSGAEAESWRAKGLAILAREIPEQILSDGGHFELSPMYHAIILENILDLLNLAAAFPGVIAEPTRQQWVEVAGKMRTWQAAMQHPDGQISFFNDAAFGIAGEGQQIEAYARRLGLGKVQRPRVGITGLAASGYFRVEHGKLIALLDAARVGPDYLPGHAHADSLSFELSLFSQRLFVNSGTSLYGNDDERLRQRGTAAHNTLELAGENSSEVWGGFRVARRAFVKDLQQVEQENGFVVSCAHDGYQRLAGKPVHKRQWRFGSGQLVIKDEIVSKVRYPAIVRYHLHPLIQAGGSDGEGRFEMPDGERVNWQVSGGDARICDASWHPEFGKSVASQCLEINMTSDICSIRLSWKP